MRMLPSEVTRSTERQGLIQDLFHSVTLFARPFAQDSAGRIRWPNIVVAEPGGRGPRTCRTAAHGSRWQQAAAGPPIGGPAKDQVERGKMAWFHLMLFTSWLRLMLSGPIRTGRRVLNGLLGRTVHHQARHKPAGRHGADHLPKLHPGRRPGDEQPPGMPARPSADAIPSLWPLRSGAGRERTSASGSRTRSRQSQRACG